jgi:hypothetical protein
MKKPISYTMEEFINKYHNEGVVTYQPQDLEYDEEIFVFTGGKWKSASFIEYFFNEKDENIYDEILATLDDDSNEHKYDTWAVIEG